MLLAERVTITGSVLKEPNGQWGKEGCNQHSQAWTPENADLKPNTSRDQDRFHNKRCVREPVGIFAGGYPKTGNKMKSKPTRDIEERRHAQQRNRANSGRMVAPSLLAHLYVTLSRLRRLDRA